MQWQRVRDALDGQDQIRARRERYLRRPDGMTTAQYDAYLSRAQYYPVCERTLRGMTGMVFRRRPVVTLPPRLEAMHDHATVDGQSLATLAERAVYEVLSVGRLGVLLDYTGQSATLRTPHVATYDAEHILSWTTHGDLLLRVVLREEDHVILELTIDDGVYTSARWVRPEPGGPWVMQHRHVPLFGGEPLTRIPVVFVGPYELLPTPPKPPFLDLADVALGHYRNSADYEHALYLTAQPTPWVSGALRSGDTPTAIGSGAFWVLPEGATAGMLEFSGAGIEAQRRAMLDKQDQMAALGARMIHEGKLRNEAADTARMRGRAELSLLTGTVNRVEEALARVLRTATEWLGDDPAAVSVELNRDWVEARMRPEELSALVRAWQSGGISSATLHENLQRGEIVPPERTVEDERDLIASDDGMPVV